MLFCLRHLFFVKLNIFSLNFFNIFSDDSQEKYERKQLKRSNVLCWLDVSQSVADNSLLSFIFEISMERRFSMLQVTILASLAFKADR